MQLSCAGAKRGNSEMTNKQKKLLIRIAVAIVLFAAAILIPAKGLLRLALYLVPYAVVGYSVLIKAVKNIAHGQIFDENFLMALATVGAFGVGEYPEAVFVMLFYQVGELFESIAVGKSRKSITGLMDLRPDYANVERNGEVVTVSPDEVAVGETLVVKPGEKIPLDGTVIEGATSINTTALTGEPVPKDVSEGDAVISGCINITGLIRIRADKPYGESTASKILELAENSAANKSKAEGFITKFAKYYTPVVVIGALILAVVPPLFDKNWSGWIYKALSFLVISCPCALVISVPLSFFAGMGGASRNGILVKGSVYLEQLASCTTAVFDKTGTLTEGSFKVTAIHPQIISEKELLEISAIAESYSNHPISQSLREAYGREVDKARVSDVSELAGRGVKAVVDGRTVWVGNGKLMDEIGADWHECHLGGTVVHVAAAGDDGKACYMGHISISDSVKTGSAEALRELKALGVKKTVMLTGDVRSVADKIASQLPIDEVHAGLLPADKVTEVEKLLGEKGKSGSLIFAGDGVNDAPVLTRADVGVAMGALGSDAAIESADVVIMDDDLRRLAFAVKTARRTLGIVKQNITFSLIVKAAVLILSAIGICSMWEAVFADVGVMVIAVINAMRAMNPKT